VTPRPSTASIRHRRFGVLCILGYVVLSWAVRFDMRRGDQIASLLYPLDTFSMYAYAPPPIHEISHPLIRDARGGIHRVTAFGRYECVEPLSGPAARCADRRGYQYHYDDVVNYIRSHAGPGESEVELISRTWQVPADAAPELVSDCIIARCRVSR
jgi:hypothetical protein